MSMTDKEKDLRNMEFEVAMILGAQWRIVPRVNDTTLRVVEFPGEQEWYPVWDGKEEITIAADWDRYIPKYSRDAAAILTVQEVLLEKWGAFIYKDNVDYHVARKTNTGTEEAIRAIAVGTTLGIVLCSALIALSTNPPIVQEKPTRSTGARELTQEEVRDRFLDCVHDLVDYWENDVPSASMHRRLRGVAFSILSTIDGVNADLPGFALIATPHETDKQFCIENGENWYPQFEVPEDACDIGGYLHDEFAKKG